MKLNEIAAEYQNVVIDAIKPYQFEKGIHTYKYNICIKRDPQKLKNIFTKISNIKECNEQEYSGLLNLCGTKNSKGIYEINFSELMSFSMITNIERTIELHRTLQGNHNKGVAARVNGFVEDKNEILESPFVLCQTTNGIYLFDFKSKYYGKVKDIKDNKIITNKLEFYLVKPEQEIIPSEIGSKTLMLVREDMKQGSNEELEGLVSAAAGLNKSHEGTTKLTSEQLKKIQKNLFIIND